MTTSRLSVVLVASFCTAAVLAQDGVPMAPTNASAKLPNEVPGVHAMSGAKKEMMNGMNGDGKMMASKMEQMVETYMLTRQAEKPEDCHEHEEFTECGSAAHSGCMMKDDDMMVAPAVCMMGCQCMPGYIRHHEKCVTMEDCEDMMPKEVDLTDMLGEECHNAVKARFECGKKHHDWVIEELSKAWKNIDMDMLGKCAQSCNDDDKDMMPSMAGQDPNMNGDEMMPNGGDQPMMPGSSSKMNPMMSKNGNKDQCMCKCGDEEIPMPLNEQELAKMLDEMMGGMQRVVYGFVDGVLRGVGMERSVPMPAKYNNVFQPHPTEGYMQCAIENSAPSMRACKLPTIPTMDDLVMMKKKLMTKMAHEMLNQTNSVCHKAVGCLMNGMKKMAMEWMEKEEYKNKAMEHAKMCEEQQDPVITRGCLGNLMRATCHCRKTEMFAMYIAKHCGKDAAKMLNERTSKMQCELDAAIDVDLEMVGMMMEGERKQNKDQDDMKCVMVKGDAHYGDGDHKGSGEEKDDSKSGEKKDDGKSGEKKDDGKSGEQKDDGKSGEKKDDGKSGEGKMDGDGQPTDAPPPTRISTTSSLSERVNDLRNRINAQNDQRTRPTLIGMTDMLPQMPEKTEQ